MTEEIEAIGTAVEGSLVGKAVEGNKGAAREDSKANENQCLNCRADLSGAFCHQCGQKAHVHRSFSAIWHDILHGVLHFDGKMWRTLPMLAFKPGQLTRRYIRGERAGFISPMALFLFSIFMMFAIFSFTGGPFGGTSLNDVQPGLTQKQLEIDKQIVDLKEQIAAAPTEDDTAEDDTKAELNEKLEELLAVRDTLSVVVDGAEAAKNDDTSFQFRGSGSEWLDKTFEAGIKKAFKNPDLVLYKLKSNGYKFAWLLIPLSLPFVWLATLGVRGHHFYDHAVFVTYSISFMSLLFLLGTLMLRVGVSNGIVALGFVFIPPLHLYKQLKYSYQLSRLGAFLRLFILLSFIVFIIALFLACLAFLGILS